MKEYNSEELENIAGEQTEQKQEKPYVPRPRWQLAMAWILAAVVLFAFLGTCYWLIHFRL